MATNLAQEMLKISEILVPRANNLRQGHNREMATRLTREMAKFRENLGTRNNQRQSGKDRGNGAECYPRNGNR
ncbi:hypothetical protein WN48_00563 [Eufriesea mexicana]|nr:hypothetical protein WN48_00563 [Eufriesea mexicana]